MIFFLVMGYLKWVLRRYECFYVLYFKDDLSMLNVFVVKYFLFFEVFLNIIECFISFLIFVVEKNLIIVRL